MASCTRESLLHRSCLQKAEISAKHQTLSFYDISSASIYGQRFEKVVLHFDAKEVPATNREEVHFLAGLPALEWSASDIDDAFKQLAFEICNDHLGFMIENLSLKNVGQMKRVDWRTNERPTQSGTTNQSGSGFLQNAIRSLIPGLQSWLALEVFGGTFQTFEAIARIFAAMRSVGVDPDPMGSFLAMAALTSGGPGFADEQVVAIRASLPFPYLMLGNSRLGDQAMALIPAETTSLVLNNTNVTDVGVIALKRLGSLKRLNLSHTAVSDLSIDHFGEFVSLEWVSLAKTRVTQEGISRLQTRRPDLKVQFDV